MIIYMKFYSLIYLYNFELSFQVYEWIFVMYRLRNILISIIH